jgi:NAD(P)H-hydrate epimerase
MYLPLEENENGEIAFSNAEKILAGCEKASAVIIGCGLGVSEDTQKLVEFLIQNLKSPIVLDADGINCIASRIDIIKNAKAGVVLTPHPGELARLLGITVEDVLKDRFGYAIKLSNELGATVVAKGVPTFIAADNGFCFLSDTGNPGLSRGGSGDILTGMIASFIAQGIPPAEAAAAGVFLHGMAADMTAENLSMQGMLPTDVIAHLPLLFKKMNR